MAVSKRQNIRKSLLLFSLLIFPATLYWFSPMIILHAASLGIINGSMLVFAALFFFSLFIGRLWCGWLCPAGALQEFAKPINSRPVKNWVQYIKWLIWLLWMGMLVMFAVRAGGLHQVQPFFQLQGGLTFLQDYWFIIYYIVITVFLLAAWIAGRRGACHSICWIAPFMIIGLKLSQWLHLPSLGLKTDCDRCVHCKKCTKVCSMSLPVEELVKSGKISHHECILCGKCADTCSNNTIYFAFNRSSK